MFKKITFIFLYYRGPNRSNSKKFLTHNDELETAKPNNHEPEKPKGTTNEKFFFQYTSAKEKADLVSESEPPSQPNTVKGKYFYKYAKNNGLGQTDHIDSSNINLHEPSQISCDSLRGFATENLTVQFDPQDDLATVQGCSEDPHHNYPNSPKRMPSKKPKTFAWKLFSS